MHRIVPLALADCLLVAPVRAAPNVDLALGLVSHVSRSIDDSAFKLEITEARDDALKAGVTISGLGISNDRPVSWIYAHVQPPGSLAQYDRENVTGGPDNFVLEVHDFHSFGEAMTRKLTTEIASRVVPGQFAAG